MQWTEKKNGKALQVLLAGRLDASWADSFCEQMLNHVRQGEHHIVLDASELNYLSSAGIRSLLVLYKALMAVQGSFGIVRANGMAEATLRDSGFGAWLDDGSAVIGDEQAGDAVRESEPDVYILAPDSAVTVDEVDAWSPWTMVDREKVRELSFGVNSFGLGIGCSGSDYEHVREHLGEFVAVSGHVVLQPPDERSRTDFMVAENNYVPTVQCVQAVRCEGEMSHLFRFAPTDNCPVSTLATLVGRMTQLLDSERVGFVIAGEVEGLVGASLIRSPGLLSRAEPGFPAIREWLSFCGERVYAHEQCIISGVMFGDQCHAHAAVFPYQALPNGCLDLRETMDRFFNGSPPRAVLHLVNDDRPGVGLGESALLRGACWCSRIDRGEVLS